MFRSSLSSLPLFMLPVLSLQAADTAVNVKAPAVEEEVPVPVDGNLQAAAIASQTWLELVDKDHYDRSWDEISSVTKAKIPKAEWTKILNKTRKPLGLVKSRDMVDQRTAVNPKNLPAGDYMVMVYKTTFKNKPAAYELVTLYLQGGQWRVLTYQVD